VYVLRYVCILRPLFINETEAEMQKDQYRVTIKDTSGAVAEEHFPVGTWREIGFWLDDHGFIDSRYLIEVRVIEADPAPVVSRKNRAVV
jgi:hypothetical protein